MLALTVFCAIALRGAELHPLFQIDESELNRLYEAGKKLKSRADLDKKADLFVIDIGKVRSPENQRWQAPFAVLKTPGVAALAQGNEDRRNYQDRKEWDERLQTLLHRASDERRIAFHVELFAWPGIDDFNGAITRNAREGDVKNVRFVLLVDGDEEHPVHPVVRPTAESSFTSDGSVSIPEVNSLTTNTSTQATAVGNGAVVNAWANSTSRVTYISHRTEEFNWYQSTYELLFPLYVNGEPVIPKSAKRLVLKVVRPTGEHTGVWDLSALQKSLSNAK